MCRRMSGRRVEGTKKSKRPRKGINEWENQHKTQGVHLKIILASFYWRLIQFFTRLLISKTQNLAQLQVTSVFIQFPELLIEKLIIYKASNESCRLFTFDIPRFLPSFLWHEGLCTRRAQS